MLWNWNTLDACFLANSWHITSAGMFAGSCIGVIALVMLLEFIRRVQREWDSYVLNRRSWHIPTVALNQMQTKRPGQGSASSRSDSEDQKTSHTKVSTFHADEADNGNGSERIGGALMWAQTIRAFIYTCQFAVAYIVMLLAMYYNGYLIICIFIGAFLGHWIFGWDLARKS